MVVGRWVLDSSMLVHPKAKDEKAENMAADVGKKVM